MSLLVVGSTALDTVHTPSGDSVEGIGGSANYFALSACHFGPVNLVGIVGEDFPKTFLGRLQSRKVDTTGLQQVRGQTFRWEGVYDDNLTDAKTVSTCLNVFEGFHPKLPASYRNATHLFLANIDPELQADVLSQVERPQVVACDTMNYWIQSKKNKVVELLPRVDIFLVNETEAKLLSEEATPYRAAMKILEWGPRVVIIKRGPYGALMVSRNAVFSSSAYLLADVKDPTGAGDSFAGGVMGYLYRERCGVDWGALKKGILFGASLASFAIEGFSVEHLESIDFTQVLSRYDFLVKMLALS